MTDDSSPARFILASGHEITITGPMSLGRSVDNAIKLDGDAVSRKHAILEITNGKLLLKDLGSSNGTYVNDKRISAPIELRDGDKVRIGPNVLTFKKGTVATSSSTMIWQTTEPLTLVRGDGSEFGVNRNMRVGRSEDNDLPLTADNSASQYHAKIDLVAGQAFITDLSSRNGTWVNGKRITGATRLKHGDKVLVGDTVFRLKVGNRSLEADAKPAGAAMGLGLFVGGGVLALIIVGVLAAGAAVAGGVWYFFLRPAPEPTAVVIQAATEPAADITLTPQVSPEQAALRALVFVVSPVGGPGSTDASTGSGSLVDGQGYVLTNFHVIGDPRTGRLYNRQNWVLIGLNWDNPADAPNSFYRAEVAQSDQNIDLALLHIVGLDDGGPLPSGMTFPYLPVGDSDQLQIGDPIAVIGFPGLGGDTPTLTRGTVSGFLLDELNNLDKGWIKTDAEINPGNSGGMAINSRGELIGVPTQAYTGTDVTGKISEIRPISFARPFLEQIP